MSRFDSIQFDELGKEKAEYIKQSFKSLELTVEGLDRSRAKDIALDKLLEASMWVNVALKYDQLSRNGGE